MIIMPPSRWQLNLREILDWITNGDGEFKDLIYFKDKEQSETDERDINPVEAPIGEQPPVSLPSTMPILPLRGLVVYPQTAIPLTIGQPRKSDRSHVVL